MSGKPTRERPLLLHLTTTDISLELLLGPQLSAFIQAGYDVHAASARGEFVDAVEARGITFHELEHSTRSMSPIDDLRAAREFFQLVRKLRPDIVHTHNPKPGVYGRIVARLARVPLVVNTVHGLYAQPTDRLRKRFVVYGLERFAAFFSHVELIQSSEDFAVLGRMRVPKSKLVELGNGIDLDRFQTCTVAERRALRVSLGFSDTDVVIGAVGRLVEEKGYLELFEAFRNVVATEPNARLLVVGPHQPDKADALTDRAVSRAASEGVIFLGHREDVDKLYGAMDVYVLASHREGFPRSAMEAAACGLPLVLTDIRGCRQIVDAGVNGILVPAATPTALGIALESLVAQPELRREMGAASIAKAQTSFDQQAVIDITLDEYNRLHEAALPNDHR